jgi:hypothetical protein
VVPKRKEMKEQTQNRKFDNWNKIRLAEKTHHQS